MHYQKVSALFTIKTTGYVETFWLFWFIPLYVREVVVKQETF